MEWKIATNKSRWMLVLLAIGSTSGLFNFNFPTEFKASGHLIAYYIILFARFQWNFQAPILFFFWSVLSTNNFCVFQWISIILRAPHSTRKLITNRKLHAEADILISVWQKRQTKICVFPLDKLQFHLGEFLFVLLS